MGWTISVGRAGANGRNERSQTLALCIEMQGLRARVQVTPLAGVARDGGAATVPAWQARRVWRNVLSTLVDME